MDRENEQGNTPGRGEMLDEDCHTAQAREALLDEKTELRDSQGGWGQSEWALPSTLDVQWLHEVEHEQAHREVYRLALELNALEEQRQHLGQQCEAITRKVEAMRRREANDEDETQGSAGPRGEEGKKEVVHPHVSLCVVCLSLI